MKKLIHQTTSGILLVIMTVLLVSGSMANAQKTVKNIVLVHGAFADGAGLATEDHELSPGAERFMAKRAGATVQGAIK